jgi:hypothetical protein
MGPKHIFVLKGSKHNFCVQVDQLIIRYAQTSEITRVQISVKFHEFQGWPNKNPKYHTAPIHAI